MKIQVKKLSPNAIMPTYGTAGAAAADLYALCPPEGIAIAPMTRVVIPTGIAIELPSADYVALVHIRSGHGLKYGLALSNGVGVIDSDYRGELQMGIVNLSEKTYTVQNGERIAQLRIAPALQPTFEEVEELSDTARGVCGFGSTGKK
ncbi:MAG: dUTP diphosphatase [Ruthenibacterium sp.]